MNLLESLWYGRNPLSLVLLPLSWMFCGLVALRRRLFHAGWLTVHKMPVPVIVIGNIAVGGTGKTPFVIWLVEFLRHNGYQPGVVSRGYGGRAAHWPQPVTRESDPSIVGDEAVLIAQRCGCPVMVDPNRVRAARALLEIGLCDVLVSDDGLQHYALARDVEIVLIDGQRRHGNQRCLPAGPLREPVSRLGDVDMKIINGGAQRGESAMRLSGEFVHNLQEPTSRTLRAFNGQRAHAVAGIGHPQRFFNQLRDAGLQIVEHAYPDHHDYAPADLEFGDELPVIMTEKDAVKCRRFAKAHHWYLPVDALVDESAAARLKQLIDSCAAGSRG